MSCCPFCTVSFRVPVIGVISKMADCSSDTDSTASGVGSLVGVGCARTGNATKVESPMSAVRRVRLILMSGFPAAPRTYSIDQRSQNDPMMEKLHRRSVDPRSDKELSTDRKSSSAHCRKSHIAEMEHRSFPDLPIEILAADNCWFVALLLVHMALPDGDSRRPTGPLGKANRPSCRVSNPKARFRMQVRLAEARGFELCIRIKMRCSTFGSRNCELPAGPTAPSGNWNERPERAWQKPWLGPLLRRLAVSGTMPG